MMIVLGDVEEKTFVLINNTLKERHQYYVVRDHTKVIIGVYC